MTIYLKYRRKLFSGAREIYNTKRKKKAKEKNVIAANILPSKRKCSGRKESETRLIADKCSTEKKFGLKGLNRDS